MGAYDTLLVERSGASLRVRLNRPERQNSITDAMLRDLHTALDEAEGTPDCRMVVIEGVDDVFCTGMDLADAGERPADTGGADLFFGLLRRFTESPRMVVSSISGRVSGGGVGLAAASDLVVATENAVFALPEALWGLLPCCVLPFLMRRVGFQKAYTMTLTTQPVTAAQAHRFHLVDEITDQPDVLLRRLAFRIGKLRGGTLGNAKRYFGRLAPIDAEVERLAVGELNRLLATDEVRAAVAGFARHQVFPWNQPR